MSRALHRLAQAVFGAPASAAPDRARAVALALVGLAAAVLLVHAWQYDFITDDAFISFVYARNLAEHGELVFNLGDRVEGYSNFSWTVLLAGLYSLGGDPELAARALGALCGVAALVFTCRLMTRALGEVSPLCAVPALLLSLSAGFACWTSGGLETQLFTSLCLASLDAYACTRAAPAAPRAGLALGALVGAAALTRPEGALLLAVLAACAGAAHAAAWWRTPDRAPLALVYPPPWARRAALAAAIFVVPHLAWRLWYYGYPLPNTYYVKAHGQWQPAELAAQMWRNGAYYLWVWLVQSGLLWAAPLALLGAASRRARLALAPALVFASAYALYAASVGGDFMGLHRFIMPLFPIAAIAVTIGVAAVGSQRAFVAAALVLAYAVTQVRLTHASLDPARQAADRGIDPPAFLIAYTSDRAAIGRALAPCLAPDDFSIVGGAGAQPYYARMRAIDVFGLVSERVAHQEPRVRARAGHTKWASDALLASLSPAYVFACYALHSDAAPPALDCAAPWLARGYRVHTMRIPGLRAGPYYSFLARADRSRCGRPAPL